VGWQLPERKQRFHAGALQLLLAILADIFEIQIPERHGFDAIRHLSRHETAHQLGVNIVRARPREIDNVQSQSRSIGLCIQNRTAHAMHRNTVERGIDCCHKPNNLDQRILSQSIQGPGTVFTTRPAQQCLHEQHSGLVN
jgi:hypothetical protein